MYQASTPSASHQAPIALALADDASHAASARSGPNRSRSDGSDVHSVSQKPPLRPLGPCPQMSASSTTTRQSGARSSSCQAVHMPVYPPPSTTTSASMSPTAGATGAAPPASSSQYPWALWCTR